MRILRRPSAVPDFALVSLRMGGESPSSTSGDNTDERSGDEDGEGDDTCRGAVLEDLTQARFVSLLDTHQQHEVDRHDRTDEPSDQTTDQHVNELVPHSALLRVHTKHSTAQGTPWLGAVASFQWDTYRSQTSNRSKILVVVFQLRIVIIPYSGVPVSLLSLL